MAGAWGAGFSAPEHLRVSLMGLRTGLWAGDGRERGEGERERRLGFNMFVVVGGGVVGVVG